MIRCPRCGSTVLGPCDEWLDAPNEKVRANFECSRCATRFRYTPPAPKETRP